MVKRLMRIAVLPAAAVTALWAGALPASGAQLGVVRTFPTPAIPFPGTIAAGPEGEMWISGGTVVGRMTTGGELTTFETSQASVGDLVAGSDGNVWFGDNDASSTVVGRLTPLGEITEFNEEATYRARLLALGADGDVWYTAGLPGIKLFSKEGEPSAIGRITPSGQVTEFSLGLESKALLDQIVAGPDGNLWFVNQAEPDFAIGRITPKGEIKEFAISGYPWLKPSGIAAGVNGNVYFGASGENPKTEEESVIGEITPAGETKIVKRLNFSEVFNLATGPEGSLWFTGLHTEPSKPNVIGRLTPAGVLEEDVANLGAETEAYLITPGPDGNMWFVTISKTGRQVDAIGTGAPAASQASPVVAGADQVGSELSCDGATWSTWAGQQPSTSLHGFDGYTWTLDGRAIAGQNAQSLLVSAADLGHQISCAVTATYQLLNVTVSAASPTVSIGAGPNVLPAQVPIMSALKIPRQTDKVTSKGALHVTLDCTGAPCSGTIRLTVKIKVTTGKGRHRHTKTVPETIASASFSTLVLGADKLSLKLNSRGISLLKAHGYTLGPNASVIYTRTGTTRASTAGAIELLGSRPKPKRK
jgi:virginiamycin B lyase